MTVNPGVLAGALGNVRIIVMRPPLGALTDAQVIAFSRALVPSLPNTSRPQPDQIIFASANGFFSLLVAADRVVAQTHALMDLESAIGSLSDRLSPIIDILQIKPSIQYGLYMDSQFASDDFDAQNALSRRSNLFDEITVGGSERIGVGFRNTFRRNGQIWDCKFETLFSSPRRLFVVLEIDSLSAPVETVENLRADAMEKLEMLVYEFIPHVVGEKSKS